MSKSRANKQNRLRAQIKRQRNDVYKFKGRKEMKKIKFFPAPHVEVRVSVTDEMIAAGMKLK